MKTNDAMTIVWSDRYEDHETGSHPERPERISSLKSALDEAGLFECNRVVAPVPASVESY